MATLDTSTKTLSISSLDEQFNLLREICATLKNNDGRSVNCWIGGKLNDSQDGYIFATEDINHLDYSPALRDSNVSVIHVICMVILISTPKYVVYFMYSYVFNIWF